MPIFGVASTVLASRFDRTSRVERKKPGRRSKGDRCQVNTRQPRVLAARAEAEAARRGMTMTDFIGQLLAEAVGIPYDPQEAIKISA